MIFDFHTSTVVFTFWGKIFVLKEILIAIFEAGMVGGIADWYAVTCLFRAPLGIETKHSRLLPKKKNEIAMGLKTVIQEFLPQKLVEEKIKSIDFSQLLSEQLQNPEFSQTLITAVSDFILQNLSQFKNLKTLQRGADEYLSLIKPRDLALDLANTIQSMANRGLFEALIPEFAKMAENYILINKESLSLEIDKRIKKKVGGFLSFFMGKKGPEVVQEILKEVQALQTPQSYLIQQIKLEAFKYSSNLIPPGLAKDQLNQSLRTLLEDEKFKDGLLFLADQVITQVLTILESTDFQDKTAIQRLLEQVLNNLVKEMIENKTFRILLNSKLSDNIFKVIIEYKLIDNAAEMVKDEILKLSTEEFTHFVETYLYNDLQYIRLNGALTGGFVGGLLYFIKTALF